MLDAVIFTTFAALLAVAVYVHQKARAMFVTSNDDFRAFQRSFLIVYLSAMLADWLQGPYLYRVYAEHGYLPEQIAGLYICGYLSAMLFGPLVGGWADRYGRRRMSIVCCALYIGCCLSVFSSGYYILMFGRFLGGISTALLLSTFESWMIAEHNRLGFPTEWLSKTFAIATFGNSCMAVLAGVVANAVVTLPGHNATRPFLLAAAVLGICIQAIRVQWTESKAAEGELVARASGKLYAGSLRPIFTDPKVLLVGVVQALYEAALYIFVFLWTPALEAHEGKPPHLGVAFAAFMVALMLGSAFFWRHIEAKWPVTRVLDLGLALACASLGVGTIFTSRSILYLAFLSFEFSCGIFLPAISTLRGELLPDTHRAAIMNWFRVPLNMIVIFFLVIHHKYSRSSLLFFCAVICAGAYFANRKLRAILSAELGSQSHLPVSHSTTSARPSPSKPLSGPTSLSAASAASSASASGSKPSPLSSSN
eukprot:m.303038 g.303038  ORF g.303038 m.303038 type:complete len:480 (-) comp15627_c0_seq1:73-1512(-)